MRARMRAKTRAEALSEADAWRGAQPVREPVPEPALEPALEPVLEPFPEPFPEPFLDAHIHLFDPRRAGGIPWPAPEDEALYRPALPERYAALARPLGVSAAIAVEASPRACDNHWLLEVAGQHPMVAGVVASLDPAEADFPRELERLRAWPLLVGIRSGNLWGRDLAQAAGDARTGERVREHLRLLAGFGLALDVANPDFPLLEAVLRIAAWVPELRIVVDHLPAMRVVQTERLRWSRLLAEMGQCRNLFAKLSEIPQRVGERVPGEAEFYRPMLEAILAGLGEDRLIFGSDWPNSDRWLPFEPTFALARACVDGLSPQALRKIFWSNGLRAYRRGCA